MKIREVIETLNNGKRTAVLGKEIGVSEKRFRAALKAAGYSYDNSAKHWYFSGEGDEPLEKSIFDYVPPKSNKPVANMLKVGNKQVTHQTDNDVRQVNKVMPRSNNIAGFPFTDEEISVLKQMIAEYLQEKANETPRERLHKRIMRLEKDKRERKTFFVSEKVIKRLDDFAEKMRFHKSDILEAALLDFIAKYEGEDEQ
jgi:Ribbon-helix-helix domain